MCLMFGENYILIWIKFLNVLLTLFRQGYRERGQEGAPAPNQFLEKIFFHVKLENIFLHVKNIWDFSLLIE